jgi:hypothetical protein
MDENLKELEDKITPLVLAGADCIILNHFDGIENSTGRLQTLQKQIEQVAGRKILFIVKPENVDFNMLTVDEMANLGYVRRETVVKVTSEYALAFTQLNQLLLDWTKELTKTSEESKNPAIMKFIAEGVLKLKKSLAQKQESLKLENNKI